MSQFQKVKTLLERDFNPEEPLKVLNSSQVVFWSWGPHKITALKGPGHSDGRQVESESFNRGLIFAVQGRKFTGWVLITLDWMDVYAVHLISEDFEKVESCRDVYVDIFVEMIDSAVETD